jgi:GTP cyclohydrolase IIa
VTTRTEGRYWQPLSTEQHLTVADGDPTVAIENTPVDALGTTTEQLQEAGSAQGQHRREKLRGRAIESALRTETDVQIAHFDVNDATEKYTDQLDEFDTCTRIEQGYAELMRHMRHAHSSLAFFRR